MNTKVYFVVGLGDRRTKGFGSFSNRREAIINAWERARRGGDDRISAYAVGIRGGDVVFRASRGVPVAFDVGAYDGAGKFGAVDADTFDNPGDAFRRADLLAKQYAGQGRWTCIDVRASGHRDPNGSVSIPR